MFSIKADDDGSVFGSVTKKEIEEKLHEKLGVEVSTDLTKGIKELGEHEVSIVLEGLQKGKVKILVEKE